MSDFKFCRYDGEPVNDEGFCTKCGKTQHVFDSILRRPYGKCECGEPFLCNRGWCQYCGREISIAEPMSEKVIPAWEQKIIDRINEFKSKTIKKTR